MLARKTQDSPRPVPAPFLSRSQGGADRSARRRRHAVSWRQRVGGRAVCAPVLCGWRRRSRRRASSRWSCDASPSPGRAAAPPVTAGGRVGEAARRSRQTADPKPPGARKGRGGGRRGGWRRTSCRTSRFSAPSFCCCACIAAFSRTCRRGCAGRGTEEERRGRGRAQRRGWARARGARLVRCGHRKLPGLAGADRALPLLLQLLVSHLEVLVRLNGGRSGGWRPASRRRGRPEWRTHGAGRLPSCGYNPQGPTNGPGHGKGLCAPQQQRRRLSLSLAHPRSEALALRHAGEARGGALLTGAVASRAI